jgi:WD40 repeat protein
MSSLVTARQPYPGLRAFLLEEADIFFGREEQVQQLLERLNRDRFLALVGTSGCGKSSLARAGLTAALEAGFMAKAGARWRVVTMRPGTQPLNNLADALLEPGVLGADHQPPGVASPPGGTGHEVKPFLLATLRRGPSGLVEFLGEPLTAGARPALPEGENLLLLVDQFEEIFRFWREGDRNEADAFVALLLEAVRQERLPVYVVLTMRSDFLGDCAIFNRLPEALNDSQFLTPRLSRQQRQKAIEGPARVFRGRVEPALVGRLLNDMGPEPDQLPLMQHVLMRLWSRACAAAAAAPESAGAEIVLRLEDYEKLGKLTEALDQHAEEVYQKQLWDEQRPIAEVLFRCLSERDVSGGPVNWRDTRRPTRLNEIAAVAGAPVEQVAAVADVFRAAGVSFLMPPPEVPLTSETLLDITHESLLRQWKRLRGWVDAEAKSADTYRRLEDEAREWQGGRAGLMERLKLNYTLEWVKREHPTAAWSRRHGNDFELALRFLKESDQAEKARMAQREREKKRRRLLTILSVGALVAIALAVVALIQGIEHKRLKTEADAARESTKNANAEAERQKQFADFFFLTRKAKTAMPNSPIASVLYCAEVEKRISQYQFPPEMDLNARDLFKESLANIGGKGYGAGQKWITNIAASENDAGNLQWMASAGQDGTIILWDKTDQPGGRAVRLIGYQAAIRKLQFARKNGWLIAHSSSGARSLVTLWKLEDAARAPRVAESYHAVYVSRDNNWLLTDDFRQAKLFDLRNEDPTKEPVVVKSDAKSFNVRFISFTDNGNQLAVINQEGDAFLCDLKTRKEKSRVDAVKLEVTDTPAAQVPKNRIPRNGEFTDKGDKLIVYFSDGSVRVWERGAEGRWDKKGTDTKLGPFKDGDLVQVVTDSRGLRAVVARKSAFSLSNPSPSDLNPPGGGTLTANDKIEAYFFDGKDLGTWIKLSGFDDSLDFSKYIQVDEQATRLAMACKRPEDGIRVWDLVGTNLTKFALPPSTAKPPTNVSSWLLASNGRWLVTGGPENVGRLWDLSSSGSLPTPANLRGHDGFVTAFAFSEKTRWLVTGGADGTLRAWDLTAASDLTAVRPSTEFLSLRSGAPDTVLISPTKSWFAFAGTNAVRFWDTAKIDASIQLQAQDVQEIRSPTLWASKGGRWLVGIYQKANDSKAILWDTKAEGKPAEYCRLDKVQGKVGALDVSPDDEWVAMSVVKDSKPWVQLWRLSAGKVDGPGRKVVQPEENREGSVWGFVAGGKGLLINMGGTFHLLKIVDKIQKIDYAFPKPVTIQAARLTPDGGLLLVSAWGGPAQLIDLNAVVGGKTPKARTLSDWPKSGPIKSFVSLNSRWLFALSSTNALSCWDLTNSGDEVSAIVSRKNPFGDPEILLSSPDGRWLVTGKVGDYSLWDLALVQRGKEHQELPKSWPLEKNTKGPVFSTDSSWLLMTDDNTIYLYTLETVTKGADGVLATKHQLPAAFYPGGIWAAAVSREGRWFAVMGEGSTIRVGDLTQEMPKPPVVLTNGTVTHPTELFISPNKLFSIDVRHSTIQIANVSEKELLKVAERVVGRNATKKEWESLAMPGPYRLIFPALPQPWFEPDLDASGQPGEPSTGVAELPQRDGTAQVFGRLTKEDPKDSTRPSNPCKVYTVQMQQGRVYQIDLHSKKFDAYLRLETEDRKELQHDDDGGGGGGGTNARIVFRCSESATYRIIATNSRASQVGDFTLTVQSR